MKQFLFLGFISACIHFAANAQCNNTIYPSPKRFGDPKYWPYSMRPATGCELNFFRTFHPFLISAFRKTEDYYSTNGWNISSPDRSIGEVDQLRQWDDEGLFYNLSLKVFVNSEKNYFKLIEDLGYFEWEFTNPRTNLNNNAEIDANSLRMQELMQMPNLKNTDPEYLKVTMQLNDVEAKNKIHISIPNVNITKDSLVEKKAKIELMQISGVAYVVKIIRDKKVLFAFNDGTNVDNDDHLDELHIYIGKWKKPQITNEQTIQKLVVQNSFDFSQPKLSLQNFMIVVKCDASLFDDFLNSVNFGKFNKQIMH
jgi:hypothetical protein